MPIGEFFDLEALSQFCAESGRYSFFFSSWPLNMYVTLSCESYRLFSSHAYILFLKSRRGCESSERIGRSNFSIASEHTIYADISQAMF
jgi:hypothetical protein